MVANPHLKFPQNHHQPLPWDEKRGLTEIPEPVWTLELGQLSKSSPSGETVGRWLTALSLRLLMCKGVYGSTAFLIV